MNQNKYRIGELLYRADSVGFSCNGCCYFVITDIENGLIYVNPIFDLKSHWFVHDSKDVDYTYRKTSFVEQILYAPR